MEVVVPESVHLWWDAHESDVTDLTGVGCVDSAQLGAVESVSGWHFSSWNVLFEWRTP